MGDVVDRAFSAFINSISEDSTSRGHIGPVADGDNSSVQFAPGSDLKGISDAAKFLVKKGQWSDALEIYSTLLRSCESSPRLLASTFHNLSMLHLFRKEYDVAIKFCRETLRIKLELSDVSVEIVVSGICAESAILF